MEKDEKKKREKFHKFILMLLDFAKKEVTENPLIKLHIYVDGEPYTLRVCLMEINANTKLGKKMLKELGFEDYGEDENGEGRKRN